MGLKIKISTGYILLILLLAAVILLFRGEETRRETLKEEESALSNVRRLATEAYMSLLDLSSCAEVAGVWTDDDANAYAARHETACNRLRTLRHYVLVPEQRLRIDSLLLLLDEKKQLLAVLTHTFGEAMSVCEIVNEKIPAIVSQVRKVQGQRERSVQGEMPPAERKTEPGKKKSVWSFFRKKEVKSAYLQQREQQGRSEQTASSPKSGSGGWNESLSATIPLLRSLNREVTEKQKARRVKLLLQMDSLYTNGQTLNRRLNTLTGDFEKATSRHLFSGYETLIAKREESFRITSGLAAFVFLFAVVLYIIVHRDVNRRYRYEKALELSDRKNKDLLLSRKNMMQTIAHDLRAPLATIRGCAELLPDEKRKSLQNEYAENILNTSDYMFSLINTLIEFYQLDTGEIKLNPSIFSPESLFKEVAGSYGSLAKKKNIRLTTTFSGPGTIANGDHPRIRQVINNLLSNAFKFTARGKIHMDAKYDNGELRFSVRDTGTGMTAEEKGRIFEAFERLDNAHGISGFGLGLSICARLVSRMEGTITVESKPGEGSTFTVLLPLPAANQRSQAEEECPDTYSRLEGRHLLVIDDDLVQLGVTKEMLERGGIGCDCCRTSWELIARLKSQAYDLLLTDIRMPETDGYEILELLRRSNIEAAKQIPVLAVTADTDGEDEYVSRGFSGRIRKPFSINELMDAVNKVIGGRERMRQEPDFSLILLDEDNRWEMFGLFVTETRKDLAALETALEKRDKETSSAILHKNLPLWETVRIDFPLSRLRKLVTCPSATWTDEQLADIEAIIRAANGLVEYAKKRQEEEK